MEFQFDPVLAFAWSVLAGFLMAMGTGGGGLLAGIGHLSILGIGDPNTIKVVNQILEFTSRVVSVPVYMRQRRIVWPLASSFGIGAPLGAIAGSWASKHYLSDLSLYQTAFGILILVVAARMLYESIARPQKRRPELQRAFEASSRIQERAGRQGGASLDAPTTVQLGLRRIRVSCGGESFAFDPLGAAAGGFAISFVGAMLGVAGGFLIAPFMASVLFFPMFFVAGTALVALMVPLLASVATYLYLQVGVDWLLVAIEVPGVAIGSLAAPVVNRRINEKHLRLFVAVVLSCIICSFEPAEALLKETVEWFGARNMGLTSDYPHWDSSGVSGVEMYIELYPDMEVSQRERFFSRNVIDALNLQP